MAPTFIHAKARKIHKMEEKHKDTLVIPLRCDQLGALLIGKFQITETTFGLEFLPFSKDSPQLAESTCKASLEIPIGMYSQALAITPQNKSLQMPTFQHNILLNVALGKLDVLYINPR